jgi:hypothetical protein
MGAGRGGLCCLQKQTASTTCYKPARGTTHTHTHSEPPSSLARTHTAARSLHSPLHSTFALLWSLALRPRTPSPRVPKTPRSTMLSISMLLERSRYLLLYLTRVLQSLLTQRTTFGKSPPAPGPRQGSTVRLLIRHNSYRRPTPFRLGSDTTVQMKYRSCRDAPTREDGMSGCSSRSSFLILCRARFAAFGAPVLLAGRGAAEPPRRPHLIQLCPSLWLCFGRPSFHLRPCSFD